MLAFLVKISYIAFHLILSIFIFTQLFTLDFSFESFIDFLYF